MGTRKKVNAPYRKATDALATKQVSEATPPQGPPADRR
jgi:hypothetical protein